MKRVQKNIKSTKHTTVRQSLRRQVAKKASVLTVKRVDSVKYAKVISYIVSSEENETNLMIASATQQ